MPPASHTIVHQRRARGRRWSRFDESHCVPATLNCDAVVTGQIYFQSTVHAELANPVVATRYVVAAKPASGPSAFPLHLHDCATVASLRAYVMHIYFVANNNEPGDGIPTLKRAELDASGGFSVVPLVEGIENLQFEYGLDTNGDSKPDDVSADPGTYAGCAADPCYIKNWLDVMTVKIHLISRATAKVRDIRTRKRIRLGCRRMAHSSPSDRSTMVSNGTRTPRRYA
jgi:type IV pilus assembly protein PilW